MYRIDKRSTFIVRLFAAFLILFATPAWAFLVWFIFFAFVDFWLLFAFGSVMYLAINAQLYGTGRSGTFNYVPAFAIRFCTRVITIVTDSIGTNLTLIHHARNVHAIVTAMKFFASKTWNTFKFDITAVTCSYVCHC